MKTVNDALEMRNYLLQQLENATLDTNRRKRSCLLLLLPAGFQQEWKYLECLPR